jgi:hypothetical protein
MLQPLLDHDPGQFWSPADGETVRTRVEPCPCCGGDSGHAYPIDICRVTGALIEGWDDCRYCGATGSVEEDVVLIDFEDLDDIPAGEPTADDWRWVLETALAAPDSPSPATGELP